MLQAGLFFPRLLNYDSGPMRSSSFADAKEGIMSVRFASTTILISMFVWALSAGAQDAARLPARDGNAIRKVVYSVADLVVPVEMDHTRPAPISSTAEVRLIELIRNTCSPKAWRAADGSAGEGEVQYFPLEMSLVVHQTPRVHAQIQQLLANLRRLQDVEIAIESRIITIPTDLAKPLETIGQRSELGKFLPADGPDAVYLSEREVYLLLNLIQSDRASTVLQTPKVTMFNGQKCALSITDSVATQPGDVDQNGEPLSAAKVDVGVRQVLQAVIEEGHRSVRLYVNASVTSQEKRDAKKRVFATRKIENLVRVKEGQTVVMKLGVCGGKECQYVILTPRIVHVETDEANATPNPAPPRAGEFQPRVFPVADLVTPITFGAPESGPCDEAGWANMMGAKRAPAPPETLLIGLITNSIAQKSWHAQGGTGAIEYFPLGQAIVVWNNSEVHQEVANLLAALRRLHDLRVGLECRLIALPEAAAQRISAGQPRDVILARPASSSGGAEEQDRAEETPPQYVPRGQSAPVSSRPTGGAPAVKALLQIHSQAPFVLDASDAKQLRSLLEDKDCKVIDQLMGAVLFNGQPARIENGKSQTFVMEVTTALEDGRLVVKPKTHTARVGTSIDVVPVVSADRKGVRLEIRVERSDLAPGAPSRTVTLNVNGQEQKYQIQQPVVNIQQLQAKVQLGESQTLVLPLGKRQVSKSAPVCDMPFVGQFFACDPPASEECRYYLVISPKIYAR
jgi:hypothetical protein